MSEVDYSRFLYKREGAENLPEYDNVAKDYSSFEKKPAKKRKAGNFIFVFIVILICFGLLFMAVDIFSNGELVAAISSSLRKNDLEYYFVAAEKQDKGAAYAKSITVKQGGGAGYIYYDGGKAYVVYSVLSDYAKAESVAAKNSETKVIVLGKRTSDSFYKSMDGLFREFCRTVEDYDNGALTDSGFTGRAERIKTSVSALLSDKKTSGDAKKKELCEFAIDGINNLSVSDGVKSEFLSKARYFIAGWAVSQCG